MISPKANEDMFQLIKGVNQGRGLSGTQETGYPTQDRSNANPQEDG